MNDFAAYIANPVLNIPLHEISCLSATQMSIRCAGHSTTVFLSTSFTTNALKIHQ